MTMEHDSIRDLIPALALGALDDAEAREVQGHLRSCAECRAELESFERVSGRLTGAAPAVPPPPALRARVLAAATSAKGKAAAPALREVPRAPSAREWLGWGLALAAGLALLLVVPRSQRNAAEAERRGQVADSLRGELQARNEELTRSREQMQLLTADDFRTVSLAAQPLSKEAAARVIYSAKLKRAHLFVQNMPAAPEGKTYEVWLIARGRDPIPAGVFQPDAHGGAELEFPQLGVLDDALVFAVTVEPGPHGGPAPTGDKVLVGVVK